MTKLFIATPAFDGKVNVQYACSLCDTKALLNSVGIGVILRIHTSGSLLVRERNDLLKEFLNSDCTHILCIDSDIGWNPMDVQKLINHDENFVAALYPARGEKTFLFRGIYEDENKKMSVSEKGLLNMEYIPAGFMLLKRCVIETMIAHYPELYYIPKAKELAHTAGHMLFATEIWEGEFWGEDYVFCRRAREAGFTIWIDPAIRLDHAGNVGAFMEVLTDKPEEKK